ncbi:MAG TPA: aminotransferase class I/II-fold pyridoxal phosphate-dependent enzyme, partial [Bacillota bacterium]|nr:aminotransferase class I/II-fold pyridoxal phosphate-dependent enzyme [Bacillota bacterium]
MRGTLGSRVVRKQLIPPEFRIDWTAAASGTGLFLMEHPNNPTGQMLISREELKKLLENDGNLVIVDEAGYEYSHQTFADLV